MQTHILITGASRGIGAAIAAALTTDAARVVALSSADGDLADPATPARLWRHSLDRLDGRIDVLINNAGVFEASPLADSDADWLAQLEPHAADQPDRQRRSLPPRRPALAGAPSRRPHCQHRQPRRTPRRQPGALALCRVQGRAWLR